MHVKSAIGFLTLSFLAGGNAADQVPGLGSTDISVMNGSIIATSGSTTTYSIYCPVFFGLCEVNQQQTVTEAPDQFVQTVDSTTVSCDLTGSPTATTGTCTWIFNVITLADQVSTPSFLTTYGSSELQIGSLTLAGAAAVNTGTTTANVASTSKSGAKKTDVAMALVAGAAAGVGMLL
ncbi:hypothetical protein OIDMADRAFT_56765 [Oidiodendron maius Zn]|uniref:Ig-like domain-containing protein n=1 Tax=Oidiodendron maius (strain Zn) TaxID=913774 RepID=A0A0C3GQS7_OIDMZ|nr:hypothetical protein OIDMADRAFT_56765 [Oidiodendron maius Zn]